MQNAHAIYVNLPVSDIQKSRIFWEALGFSFNEKFSDEKAICLVLQEACIYAMLIQQSFFATFTNRPIADGKTTQVLLAIKVDDKDTVNAILAKALANGGQRYREAADHGWMYYDSFTDIDGHQWEVMSIQE